MDVFEGVKVFFFIIGIPIIYVWRNGQMVSKAVIIK